ncbi:hypothetical protein [Brevibacterium sp. HMSC24B04]|uniref:hypothetical protein n=1 Tax=Brevibacterium sp. HMSC24B04 TaxID=1581060 RepID=UPI0008A3C50E|nr:hypothetical protein [Brevibacterium sp. HMSC24B04]OFT94064.1 hypothetical protein HMPREF3092_04150 [Brevibacterium sp. HMSC24B04]
MLKKDLTRTLTHGALAAAIGAGSLLAAAGAAQAAPAENPGAAQAQAAPAQADGQGITRDEIIKRAEDRMAKAPYYSQGEDYFDDYRRDCSGFVSYAWNSGGPGEASFTFVPNGVAHNIAWEEIQPGDAITGPDHIVLVKAVNPDGSFELLEHGGGQTGKEAPNTRHATKDELISQNVGEPIRYNGVA